jgi:hypothetical protein
MRTKTTTNESLSLLDVRRCRYLLRFFFFLFLFVVVSLSISIGIVQERRSTSTCRWTWIYDTLSSSTQIITEKGSVSKRTVCSICYCWTRSLCVSIDDISQLLRHVLQAPALPRPLTMSVPISTVESNRTVSIIVSDGTNKKLQTETTMATVMPTLPIVRELISYVPTMKNVATRGHLIGIPYLGDRWSADDQRLINSISIEPSKQTKLIRSILIGHMCHSWSCAQLSMSVYLEKKLDEATLDKLYESLRMNTQWQTYTNEQLIDAILRRFTVCQWSWHSIDFI